MAEEKKKRRIIKQIFKWLGLGLLVALIMGALIYDAPGKVIAILLIILAGCTILPKGAVKWFWLSVAAVVVILIIWVFLPDENGGWRPFTFEKELATLQAKYAVPDSENAALLYSKLFETLDIDADQPEFFNRSKTPSTDGPWRSADHPETAEWLKDQQKTIGTLIEICRIEKCQFPIKASPMSRDKEFDHLSKMRRYAFLLVSSANNDVAEGRIDTGLEKYLCLLQIAKHLYQQPAMTDFLIGSAIEGLSFKQLKRFMIEGQPGKEQLQLIANSVKDLENNWSPDFRKWLEYDKLLCKNMFSFWYEINQAGKTRLRRNQATVSTLSGQTVPPPSYWKRKRTKASAIPGWFFFPSTPQKFAKVIDATYEKYYTMADPNYNWSKKPPEVQRKFKWNFPYMIELFADMSGGTYYTIHERYLDYLAGRRGSRLLVAIKQYKNKNSHWPETLDEIKPFAPAEIFVDPINCNSFVYKPTDDSFKLYSKGKNNIDEDGKRDRWGEEKTGADDWLIWPPRGSRIALKEDSDTK